MIFSAANIRMGATSSHAAIRWMIFPPRQIRELYAVWPQRWRPHGILFVGAANFVPNCESIGLKKREGFFYEKV